MTTGERITCVRNRAELSQKEFAESIGISTSSISRLEKNQQELSVPVAKSISLLYHVSYEWLIYGDGDMVAHSDLTAEELVPDLVDVLNSYPAILRAVKVASDTMDASDWHKLNDFIDSLGGSR